MKEYFSHDYHARGDENIVRLLRKDGWLGYGIYWALIEMLYENGGSIPKDYELLAYEMRTQCERIKSVCEDYGLFFESDNRLSSISVNRRLEERAEKSAKAKISSMKRWGNNANAMRTHRTIDANGGVLKESKGKEIKEKERKEESDNFSSGELSEADLVKAISGPTNRKPCPLWVKKKCIAASGHCEVQGSTHISGDCYLPG